MTDKVGAERINHLGPFKFKPEFYPEVGKLGWVLTSTAFNPPPSSTETPLITTELRKAFQLENRLPAELLNTVNGVMMSRYMQGAIARQKQAEEERERQLKKSERHYQIIQDQSPAYFHRLWTAVQSDVAALINSKLNRRFGALFKMDEFEVWVEQESLRCRITRKATCIYVDHGKARDPGECLQFFVNVNDEVQTRHAYTEHPKSMSIEDIAKMIFEPLLFPNGR